MSPIIYVVNILISAVAMKYITRGKEDSKWFLGTLCLLPPALGNYKTNKNEESILSLS